MDSTNGPVPPDLIADVKGNPPTDPAAPAHPGGAGGSVPDARLTQKIERAATDAVNQHLAESPRRKRGQRGPDKAPRAPRNVLRLEEMGNRPDPASLGDRPPVPLEIDWENPQPAFDEKAAAACIDIAIGLLNDGAAAIVAAVAKKQTGDDGLAAEAAKAVRMAEKIEAAIRTGAMGCVKKYSVRLDYANEIMLGGGLVIWLGGVGIAIKGLKAKGAALRAEPAKEAA